mmetsp:Transcript_19735/g.33537  ORF Transcript_19735/g.33537 Transcript_19735/m.33537 type:complete len:99 (+) Transcript_19735:850-1146(+)
MLVGQVEKEEGRVHSCLKLHYLPVWKQPPAGDSAMSVATTVQLFSQPRELVLEHNQWSTVELVVALYVLLVLRLAMKFPLKGSRKSKNCVISEYPCRV